MVFSEADSPLARLERSEGLQSLVHAGKVPEAHVKVVAAGHQTGSRGVQGQSRYLRGADAKKDMDKFNQNVFGESKVTSDEKNNTVANAIRRLTDLVPCCRVIS